MWQIKRLSGHLSFFFLTCQLWGPGDILVIGAAALCHGELAVFWLDLVCEVVILIEAGRIPAECR